MFVKHGETAGKRGGGTPTWNTWHNMIQRCCDPNAANYRNYGGRGISICERWRNSFENFKADMGARPVGRTLDRIDRNGNYEPANCKWSTPKEQAANRRLPERRTHCFKGHELATVGWYTYPDGRRECNECRMRTAYLHRDKKNAARRERTRMKNLKNALVNFHKSMEAQDLVEYALVAVIIALGAIVGMGKLSSSINQEFANIAAKLT